MLCLRTLLFLNCTVPQQTPFLTDPICNTSPYDINGIISMLDRDIYQCWIKIFLLLH